MMKMTANSYNNSTDDAAAARYWTSSLAMAPGLTALDRISQPSGQLGSETLEEEEGESLTSSSGKHEDYRNGHRRLEHQKLDGPMGHNSLGSHHETRASFVFKLAGRGQQVEPKDNQNKEEDGSCTTKTTRTELLITRLSWALQETRANLDIILASYHHLQHQSNRPGEGTKEIVNKISVAIQTDNDDDDDGLAEDTESRRQPIQLKETIIQSHTIEPKKTNEEPKSFGQQDLSGSTGRVRRAVGHRRCYPGNGHGCSGITSCCSAVGLGCCCRRHRPRSSTAAVDYGMVENCLENRNDPILGGCWCERIRLNDAWQLAGIHTRQRMGILGRHYHRLYTSHQRLNKQCRRLSRSLRRSRRRALYLQHQHQILLESIGRQVDDVASNWAGRLKGLLQAVESADAAGATDEEKVKSGTLDLSRSSTSSSVVEEEDVDEASLQSQHHPSSVAASTTCTSSTQPPFSLYRWYSSLSLKLSWLQTSHTTVFDNILYTFYFRLE